MKIARTITLLLLTATCSAVAHSQTSSSRTDAASPTPDKKSPANSEKQKREQEEQDRLEARRQKSLDFLKRSHVLNDQILEREKVNLLNIQISTAGKLDKVLARDWAREMFDLGARLKPESGAHAQLFAVKSLVTADPDEALAMLTRVEPAFLAHSPHEFPGASTFDNTFDVVFTSYIKVKGKPGMIEVLRTAGTLGDAGRYPYSGVMAAAESLNDPVLAAKVATALITRFQSRVDPSQVSYDFSKMLVDNEKWIPKSLLKPAVDLAAEALQNYPVNDDNKEYFVTKNFAKGSVTAHGPVEIGLIQFAPLLKRVDPELADEISRKYAAFAQPAAELDWKTGGGGTMTMGFSGNQPTASSEMVDQRYQILSKLTGHVWQDEDRGAKVLSQVTDPSIRAEAYASAAQHMASIDPAKAAEFAAEADRAAAQIDDPMAKFRSLAAKVQADASNNQNAAVQQELELTFRMADRLMRKASDERDGNFEVLEILRQVVRQTAKLEPDLTGANIETLQLPYDRALLLAEAAQTLALQITPPPKSSQAQK